jgi:plasmid stabilization system protein ParE
MTRRLVVEPTARLELGGAADWYDVNNPGLGSEFIRAFEAVSAAILRNPFQYQAVRGKIRRAPLRRFPYSLISTVSDNEIVIVYCFHGRRDPKRWQDRIR